MDDVISTLERLARTPLLIVSLIRARLVQPNHFYNASSDNIHRLCILRHQAPPAEMMSRFRRLRSSTILRSTRVASNTGECAAVS